MPRASPPQLRIEPLEPHHDRPGFACGVASLDQYLHTQAGQDLRRKAASVFVLVDLRDPGAVLGYYTLAATAVPQGDIPAAARKHIPRYPLVSATLVGRLAVARALQDRGLGALLLADAWHRAFVSASSVGSSMLVVDAISEEAAAFYAAYGFLRLPDTRRLILPMVTIGRLLSS